MDKYKLVREIIKTCKYFKIMTDDIDGGLIEKKIIDGLDDILFVENLLSILYYKMKLKRFQKTLNRERLKNLLFELEKIRLNLEFKGG